MIQASIKKHLHGASGEFELDVDLQIAEGELIALFGPSGVGKTTLLRCLAGLDQPEQGSLIVNGESWLNSAARINLPPQQRRVGYVFQDYALFPNMTVRANLEFALRPGSAKKRVDELLALMDIGELQHRKPDTLSGGQKQRVALARALASAPRLLLLDEPFSALDAQMRSHLQDEVLKLQRDFGITTIIVSHDVGEVYKLASRVLLMDAGQLVAPPGFGQGFGWTCQHDMQRAIGQRWPGVVLVLAHGLPVKRGKKTRSPKTPGGMAQGWFMQQRGLRCGRACRQPPGPARPVWLAHRRTGCSRPPG